MLITARLSKARFAARRWPVIDSLSENAYGIYLVHYLFITWLQYLLLRVASFALAKAMIVFTGTLIPELGYRHGHPSRSGRCSNAGSKSLAVRARL
jgi:surface polysaccharide O-acyltransferase-like enzyme